MRLTAHVEVVLNANEVGAGTQETLRRDFDGIELAALCTWLNDVTDSLKERGRP